MGSCGCAEAAAASLVQAHARARGVLSCPCWPLAHAHAAAAARHRLARAHERAQQATHSAAALEVRVGAAGDARARARAGTRRCTASSCCTRWTAAACPSSPTRCWWTWRSGPACLREERSSFCRGANNTTDNTGTQCTRRNITHCICMLREHTLKATCKGRTMDRSPGPVCLPAKLSSAKRLPYMLRHPVPSPCSSCQVSLLQYSAAASSRAARLGLLEQRNTPSAPLQSPHPAHKAACLTTERAEWVTPNTIRCSSKEHQHRSSLPRQAAGAPAT